MKKLFLIIALVILCFATSAKDYQKKSEKIKDIALKYLSDSYFKELNISKSSLSENPYKLDSIIYTSGNKEVFEYDEWGRTTDYRYYEKSGINMVQLFELVEFDYFNGNNVLFRISGLNEENELTVFEQSEKLYNSEGRMTSEIYWTLDEHELEPNTFNFLTHSVDSSAMSFYNWNSNINSWELTGYELYYYDPNGTLKQLDVFEKNNLSGIIELRTRLLFITDSKGREIEVEFLSAPYVNGIWEREMAFAYEYDGNDRLVSMINYRNFRGLTEYWYKSVIYYNQDGLPQIIDSFNGTDSINNYLEYKTEYQYENNSLTGQLESMFDIEAGELKLYNKYEFKHDSSIDTTGLILPNLETSDYYYERNSFFDNKYFKESVLKSFIKYEIDTIAGELVKKEEATYFYSRIKPENTSSYEIVNSNIKCSPNPFTDNISLSLNEKSDYRVNIYDITGKIKYSERITGNNFNIYPNISDRGIYILELSSDVGKTYRTKIIRK